MSAESVADRVGATGAQVSRRFVTGLGGGAPWFPSTGVYEGESQVTVLEEMLHTIQYCALSPRSELSCCS